MALERVRILAFAVVTCLLVTADALAYLRTAPGMPRDGDRVTVIVGGIWGDSTHPRDPELRIDGNHIEIAMVSPRGGGLSAVTPWWYELDLGMLDEGLYSVSATLDGAELEAAVFQVLPADELQPVLLPAYTADPITGAGGSRFASSLHINPTRWLSFYPGTAATPALGSASGRIPWISTPSTTPSAGGRLLWIGTTHASQAPDHLRLSHTLESSVEGGEKHHAQLPVAYEHDLFEGEFSIEGAPNYPSDRYRYTLRLYHLGVPGAGRAYVAVERSYWTVKSLNVVIDQRDDADRSYPNYKVIHFPEGLISQPTSGGEPIYPSIRIYPLTPGLYYALLTITENATARVIPFAP